MNTSSRKGSRSTSSTTTKSTGLSRADAYSLVYVGQLIGITMMFSGFALVAPAHARRPEPAPSAPAPAR